MRVALRTLTYPSQHTGMVDWRGVKGVDNTKMGRAARINAVQGTICMVYWCTEYEIVDLMTPQLKSVVYIHDEVVRCPHNLRAFQRLSSNFAVQIAMHRDVLKAHGSCG